MGDTEEGRNAPDRPCRVVCLKGNFIDRETRQNGGGWHDEVSYTLDATDRHGVVYPEIVRTLTARMDSSPCVDRGTEVIVYLNDHEKHRV